MKKIKLFKTLLDILCFFYLIGIISFASFIPYGKTTFNHITIDIESWNIFYWFIAVLGLITSLIFLRGLYYLRKVARLFSDKYFSDVNITSLKKVGVHFFLTGALYTSIIVVLWMDESITTREFTIGTDFDLISPLILMIIGVFFLIHSRNLLLAKRFKEENELTV